MPQALFAKPALLFVKPAAQQLHALHASLITIELLLTGNAFVLLDSIKLLTKMEALHVENALLHALPALFYQLFAQTVIQVPIEFLDSIIKETKSATVCQVTLPTPMEIVSNLTVLLIHIAQLVKLY